ncbi:hypothetical protein ACS3SW_04335 [Roseobacteraceae bacterium S113]
MTNQLAIWLGVCVVGALVLDLVFFGTDHILFLAKKGMELIEWMAFWR